MDYTSGMNCPECGELMALTKTEKLRILDENPEAKHACYQYRCGKCGRWDDLPFHASFVQGQLLVMPVFGAREGSSVKLDTRDSQTAAVFTFQARASTALQWPCGQFPSPASPPPPRLP